MVKSVFVVINCSHNISNLTRIAHKIVLKYLKSFQGLRQPQPPGPYQGSALEPLGASRPPAALTPQPFNRSITDNCLRKL